MDRSACCFTLTNLLFVHRSMRPREWGAPDMDATGWGSKHGGRVPIGRTDLELDTGRTDVKLYPVDREICKLDFAYL